MPITERVDPGLLKNLPNLPENEQREILALIEELEEAESKEEARDGFMPFIKRVWPAFIEEGIIRSWEMLSSELLVGNSKD